MDTSEKEIIKNLFTGVEMTFEIDEDKLVELMKGLKGKKERSERYKKNEQIAEIISDSAILIKGLIASPSRVSEILCLFAIAFEDMSKNITAEEMLEDALDSMMVVRQDESD